MPANPPLFAKYRLPHHAIGEGRDRQPHGAPGRKPTPLLSIGRARVSFVHFAPALARWPAWPAPAQQLFCERAYACLTPALLPAAEQKHCIQTPVSEAPRDGTKRLVVRALFTRDLRAPFFLLPSLITCPCKEAAPIQMRVGYSHATRRAWLSPPDGPQCSVGRKMASRLLLLTRGAGHDCASCC